MTGAALLLLVVGAVAGYGLRGKVATSQSPKAPVSSVVQAGGTLTVAGTADSFDRPDNPASLGSSSPAMPWRAVAGTWGIVANEAALTNPAPDKSIAIVPLSAGDGAVQVRLPKMANGAGLVFRYRDNRNYWAVVAIPPYATWAVLKTVDGVTSTVRNTGLSATQDGTTVAVRMIAKTIDVAIGGEIKTTITDGALLQAPMVGMIVRGPNPGDPRFDDFQLAPAG